jgi:hypothetical protein
VIYYHYDRIFIDNCEILSVCQAAPEVGWQARHLLLYSGLTGLRRFSPHHCRTPHKARLSVDLLASDGHSITGAIHLLKNEAQQIPGWRKDMKPILALTVTIGVAATTMAAPISYSEDFEGYTAGSANRYLSPYTTNWPDLPAVNNRYPVDTTQRHSGTNSLLVENGYGNSVFAISHEFGQEVQATDADPLVVSAWLYINSTAARKTSDFYFELANNDLAPATSGTLHNAVTVAWPYSVRSNADTSAYLYDGTNWNRTSTTIPSANTWTQLTVTIKSSAVDISVGGVNSNGWTRTYAGTFDRINLRHVNSTGGGLWLDDINVSGGVVVPEPMTLVLVGIGGLAPLLHRRTRR